jgi:hypothetical protein
MHLHRRAGYLTAMLFVGMACGCGDSSAPVKVKGTVTVDSLPVEGAVVTFVPDGTRGRDATGRTRADGSFELSTFGKNDGVVPGTYKVLVEYHEPPEMTPEAKSPAAAMQAVRQASNQESKRPPRYRIPAQYGDRGKTPLRQTVPPDGKIAFELKSST